MVNHVDASQAYQKIGQNHDTKRNVGVMVAVAAVVAGVAILALGGVIPAHGIVPAVIQGHISSAAIIGTSAGLGAVGLISAGFAVSQHKKAKKNYRKAQHEMLQEQLKQAQLKGNKEAEKSIRAKLNKIEDQMPESEKADLLIY